MRLLVKWKLGGPRDQGAEKENTEEEEASVGGRSLSEVNQSF